MCEPEDIDWINHFRSRIMSSSDPLAQYRQARSPKPVSSHIQNHSPEQSEPKNYTYSQRSSAPKKSVGCLICIIGVVLVIVAIIVIANVILGGQYAGQELAI